MSQTAVLPALAHAPANWPDASVAPGRPTGMRRSSARRHRPAALATNPALQGAAQVVRPVVQQQLPLTARASVSVSNGLLYPVVGAALGTLLLGIPGTIIGAVAGWYLSGR